jgi:hypothetical protein
MHLRLDARRSETHRVIPGRRRRARIRRSTPEARKPEPLSAQDLGAVADLDSGPCCATPE